MQGCESFKITWLSRQQSVECKQFCSSLNDGDGASLGEKQHLIVAYGAISFHCTKLKKKKENINANYTKLFLTSS